MLLRKGVWKVCSKLTGEHPCRSVISTKLQNKFIGIVLRHGCSPVNLLHIFRTTFLRNIKGCFCEASLLRTASMKNLLSVDGETLQFASITDKDITDKKQSIRSVHKVSFQFISIIHRYLTTFHI